MPQTRGSTSLSATLLKLHRTAAFSAVFAANRYAASDLLHPAVGDLQVAYVVGREACIDLVAVLGLDCPDTSHIASMRAGVECLPGDGYVT